MFRRFHVNPFDLLGQAEPYPPRVFLPGKVEPRLEIAWNSFHQNFLSGVPVFFRWTHYSKTAPLAFFFRDCRVERPIPQRAIFAAFLLHIAFMIFPWSQLPAAPRRNPAFDNTELTWSGPIQDLPVVDMPRAKPKLPKSAPDQPPPAEGADAYHPRQRIYTDPVHPTHPRQTLINPAAPPVAPKILPDLPNIVQLAAVQVPARPHLQISAQSVAKLRPKQTKTVATSETPPDMPNLEQRPAHLSMAVAETGPAKPKLSINAGSVPRAAARAQEGDTAAAPEVPSVSSSAGGSSGTLIALSAFPAPPAPVVPIPQGNLAARVSISPEGRPGASGSSANNGASGGGGAGSGGSTGGKGEIAVSISGGAPKPNTSVSGLGGAGKLTLPKSSPALKRPDPNAVTDDPPERDGPPNFAALPPGAKPEQIFASKRIYSMNVNMPNFNSATGSWIIHFSELHLSGLATHVGDVSAPVPMHKVDPKYPQSALQERIEGEVILYGVIRQDGTVDSVQLVRGIDEQLDANAMSAFSQWKFEPAIKEGQPVALEAIVHIPFHGPERF